MVLALHDVVEVNFKLEPEGVDGQVALIAFHTGGDGGWPSECIGTLA